MTAPWARAAPRTNNQPRVATAQGILRHTAPLATAGATSLAADAPVLVIGPGSLEMRMLTAKLAARSGFRTSLFLPDQNVNNIRYLYSGENKSTAVEDSSEPRRAAVIADAKDLGVALGSAEALLLISDGASMQASFLDTVLKNAPQLKRIVLLSNMGVTRATAGLFGLGKGAAEQLEAERRLAGECASADIGLSIVRVGTLKGGGSGPKENVADVGLAPAFYNSIVDLEIWKMTESYDKFTLGAKVTAGDPFEQPNAVKNQIRKGQFDPQDDETSRVVAAAAMVAALRHEVPLEFSVSSARAEAPPSSGEWEALLSNL